MSTRDPALWGFFGVVVTTLGLIFVEQIRSRRRTEDVKQEVLNSKDSNDTLLHEIKQRLDDHIRWHLEHDSRRYVYIDRNRRG